STTPSAGAEQRVDRIRYTGRVGATRRALRARADRLARVTSAAYASSVNQRASCSTSRTPARTSRAPCVRLRSNGSGSGSSADEVGCGAKSSYSAIDGPSRDRTFEVEHGPGAPNGPCDEECG